MARATGGFYLFTNVTRTAGVRLLSGSSAWVTVSDSTMKRRYGKVNTEEVLNKVVELPIERWSYKAQDEGVQHVGPMAQDFWNAFHLGEDSLAISTIDPDGVALAAIQELAKQNESKDKKIADLETRVKQLEAAIMQFGNLNNSDKQ